MSTPTSLQSPDHFINDLIDFDTPTIDEGFNSPELESELDRLILHDRNTAIPYNETEVNI